MTPTHQIIVLSGALIHSVTDHLLTDDEAIAMAMFYHEHSPQFRILVVRIADRKMLRDISPNPPGADDLKPDGTLVRDAPETGGYGEGDRSVSLRGISVEELVRSSVEEKIQRDA